MRTVIGKWNFLRIVSLLLVLLSYPSVIYSGEVQKPIDWKDIKKELKTVTECEDENEFLVKLSKFTIKYFPGGVTLPFKDPGFLLSSKGNSLGYTIANKEYLEIYRSGKPSTNESDTFFTDSQLMLKAKKPAVVSISKTGELSMKVIKEQSDVLLVFIKPHVIAIDLLNGVITWENFVKEYSVRRMYPMKD
jgi:hypothetical protein